MTNLPPSVFTQEVAGILRGARARLDVPQGLLAEAVDVSQSQMSKMLRGERQITLDQLDIICELLELEVPAVIAEADDITEARFGHNRVVLRVRGTNESRVANGAAPYRDDLLVVTTWDEVLPVEPSATVTPLPTKPSTPRRTLPEVAKKTERPVGSSEFEE